MNNVLRGVSPKPYRQTLMTLIEEGWEASITGGGHIALTHDRVDTPIFTSKTPSCGRSAKNLMAQCRRALRMSDLDRATGIKESFGYAKTGTPRPATSTMALGEAHAERRSQTQDAATDASRPRRPRWSKLRKEAAARGALTSARKSDVPCDAPSADLAHEKTNADPVKIPPVEPPKERNPVMLQDSATTDLMDNTASESATPRVTRADHAGQKMPKTKEGKVKAANLPVIDIPSDFLALLSDLAAGRKTALEITPEMVGKTLVLSGSACLMNAGTELLHAFLRSVGEATAEPVSHPVKPAARVAQAEADRESADIVLKFTRDVIEMANGTPVTIDEILDLDSGSVIQGTGRSRADRVRRALARLIAEGSVVCISPGRPAKNTYIKS